MSKNLPWYANGPSEAHSCSTTSRTSAVRARSAEVLDVVLQLWASEGPFAYHGKFFDIETPVFEPVKERGYYMKPFQRPHPPIAVAASTPASGSMRMAG